MKLSRGFSLIEVLLALAVGGIVLMAASSLLVTISQAWANRPATRDAFDAHVNGIAHFLTAVFEEATYPNENSKSFGGVELERPVGFSDREDPLIKCFLPEAPPFFIGHMDQQAGFIRICFLRKRMVCFFYGIQSFKSWKRAKMARCN